MLLLPSTAGLMTPRSRISYMYGTGASPVIEGWMVLAVISGVNCLSTTTYIKLSLQIIGKSGDRAETLTYTVTREDQPGPRNS